MTRKLLLLLCLAASPATPALATSGQSIGIVGANDPVVGGYCITFTNLGDANRVRGFSLRDPGGPAAFAIVNNAKGAPTGPTYIEGDPGSPLFYPGDCAAPVIYVYSIKR